MSKLSEHIKSADWKTEKHVPVIEAPDTVKADETFEVRLSLGKEIAHPNTTEHHIRWITLYYYPEGEGAPFEVGHFEFNAHGESVRAEPGTCVLQPYRSGVAEDQQIWFPPRHVVLQHPWCLGKHQGHHRRLRQSNQRPLDFKQISRCATCLETGQGPAGRCPVFLKSLMRSARKWTCFNIRSMCM